MPLSNEAAAAATPSSAPVRPAASEAMSLRQAWSGLDQASVMGTELMAAILTWTVLGWLADGWLGTGPWLMVAGALLGNAAGLYLVWLRSERMNREELAATDGDAGAT